MNLQLRIFRLQYSSERICAAIGDISTIQCSLYCKLGTKYSAYPPVYAIWTVVPDIYNAFTAPHVQASIFIWTYLRCYWRYLDNSILVILKTWCQIQRTPLSLLYVKCGPGQIQCNYGSVYSGINIQLNVSALLLGIRRLFNDRNTANLVPDTAHILRFTLCELWSRTYTMHLQLHIFRLQYSFERISPAIGDIPTINCALYCKLGARYSAHPPVDAMCTLDPDLYNVITASHIQASIFDWSYLRYYWRYSDISMRIILLTWCQIQRTSSCLRYVNCVPGHIQILYSSAYIGFNIKL
jgi:hypothetical protein